MPERHRISEEVRLCRRAGVFASGLRAVHGHISGVVDIPCSCATLWLPTEIFDFDIQPSASGPVKHIKGDVDMPLSRDL